MSLIVVLAFIVAVIGLFWQSEGNPYTFSTLYGEKAQISGQGLYEHDTVFSAGVSQGAGLIALFVALSLLIISYVFLRNLSRSK